MSVHRCARVCTGHRAQGTAGTEEVTLCGMQLQGQGNHCQGLWPSRWSKGAREKGVCGVKVPSLVPGPSQCVLVTLNTCKPVL